MKPTTLLLRSRLSTLLILLTLFSTKALATTNDTSLNTDDPCRGHNAFLALINRPTNADSVCVLQEDQAIAEVGLQYLSARPDGAGYNYPQLQINVGLPGKSQLTFLSSYNQQTSASGLGPITLGFKHEVGRTQNSIFSAEGIYTPPFGSASFGSAKGGITLNGIASYAVTPHISLLGMLGLSEQSLPSLADAHTYVSVNPDVVLSWQHSVLPLQLYAEIFGQTSTGTGTGGGYNADAGIQYLITQNFEVDLEQGVRLTGELGGYNYYTEVGFGFLFG
ncbi:MAG: transporter [Gammaproteobacteria bacterium]|nr:transporter [Gammaproteobacteria bacterium]